MRAIGKYMAIRILEGVYTYTYVVSKRPDLARDIIEYTGNCIIDGTYTYEYVVTRNPDMKEELNAYLESEGREDLIDASLNDSNPNDKKSETVTSK